MNDAMYDDIALEKAIASEFGMHITIDSVIGRRFPVSRTSTATLFLSEKKQLFLYINGQQQLTLGDIRRIVTRAGLKPHEYVPPKGRPQYFDEVGTAKFRQVFPGRGAISPADIAYYRTLALYMPALVLISDVVDGHVYQFDSDTANDWRLLTKFTYRRIQTS